MAFGEEVLLRIATRIVRSGLLGFTLLSCSKIIDIPCIFECNIDTRIDHDSSIAVSKNVCSLFCAF